METTRKVPKAAGGRRGMAAIGRPFGPSPTVTWAFIPGCPSACLPGGPRLAQAAACRPGTRADLRGPGTGRCSQLLPGLAAPPQGARLSAQVWEAGNGILMGREAASSLADTTETAVVLVAEAAPIHLEPWGGLRGPRVGQALSTPCEPDWESLQGAGESQTPWATLTFPSFRSRKHAM